MAVRRPSDWLDWTFEIALWLKGIDGLLETVGGVVLLAVPHATLDGWVVALTQHELSEDPGDVVATTLRGSAAALSGSGQVFAGLYLLAHGLVKIVLVAAVLRDRLWAYPWMIAFLVLFIAYQAYRMVLAPSAGLALLTVFDLLVVWLTVREYGRLRRAGAVRS